MIRGRHLWHGLSVMLMALFLLTGTVLAAGQSSTDWEAGTITAVGTGVAPTEARSAAQAQMLARRAAVVDAYRQLAEQVRGVSIDGTTTVENMMTSSDRVTTHVQAFIQGARIVDEKVLAGGGYSVTMRVPVFGVNGSLAGAVLEQPSQKQPYPALVPDIAPALPSYPSDYPHTQPIHGQGSPAAPAPAGQAIGNYTGLIVDCRGLGLRPVMSPVIKNAHGTLIYGYKNLDYDKVVANGMAGYARDFSRTGRAGKNPLVVRAVSVQDNGSAPVLSVADANRVLLENGASGFLDTASVVFLR